MDSDYFDDLIRIHQDMIASFQRWWRIILSVGVTILLLSGIAWVLAAAKVIDPPLAPPLATSFGVLTSTLAFLPYKEIGPRRLQILRCEHLKRECEKIKQLPQEEQDKRIKSMNDLMKETAG